MSDIFISYRRQDGDAYAGRLHDRLGARFEKARIFMDVDMDLGIDFINEIEQRVGSCKVLVAVIGRSWLEAKDSEGRRRLDDANDWVRVEIAAALERDIPIIPALVGGARMPAASDLPGVLSKLTRRQAIEISHSGFHTDVDRLIKGLERILPSQERKAKKAAPKRKAAEASGNAGTRAIVERTKPRPKAETLQRIWVDPETKLQWTTTDNGRDIDWAQANRYAKRLRLGGYSDWRLPTLSDLIDLWDPKRERHNYLRKPFRLTEPGVRLWSSSRIGSRNVRCMDFSWTARTVKTDHTLKYKRRAFCVRGVRGPEE